MNSLTTPADIRSLIWRIATISPEEPGRRTNRNRKQIEKETEKETEMKSYKSYSDAQYLRKEDISFPQVVTVEDAREEKVAAPGSKPKLKVVVYFRELEKGMVSNQAHGDTFYELTGSDDPEKWIGTQVELYVDS